MATAEIVSNVAKTKHLGMGAIPHENGVAFRVWAPHAESVHVAGTFNDWAEDTCPMEAEEHGHWYVDVPEAKIGDEYKYLIQNGEQRIWRIDPRARDVTNSVGSSIVHDPHFDWEGDDYQLPPWNELVIYEMHIGTFHRTKDHPVGTFYHVLDKFDHLKSLGVNVLQLMPTAEFAGDFSWGYNPAHIFAVESVYGGPQALKEFVKEAHRHGFGVILDVVYNHFGPSDLDLWQFDGWSENGKGGIYFYNDWRSNTPWGDTRPDYGRGEVRQFIRDNALMWLEDYHIDGLRYDMTLFIRSVDGSKDLPEGWGLAQWVNSEISAKYPNKILIAEDLQNNEYLTKPPEFGGAGFSAQWDAAFVHPVRDVVQQPDDNSRDMAKLVSALTFRYNIDSFERVIYSESHDEVANGKSRVPSEIDRENPGAPHARDRANVAAGLALTAPGIPMLFQGQEFLQDGWFNDAEALNWHLKKNFPGVVRLYRDLINLRLNKKGVTKGLTGQHILVSHVNDAENLVAFQRWADHGPGDDVMVIVNLSNNTKEAYRIGLPDKGTWYLRLNSVAKDYGTEFPAEARSKLKAERHGYDGLAYSAEVAISPYSLLIYSRNPTKKH